MVKNICIENHSGISLSTVVEAVAKIVPQVEVELKRRCNRVKTFYVSTCEINIKYEKEKLTFFASRKKLSKAIGGNN